MLKNHTIIAVGENLNSDAATVYARNACNPIELVPVNEDVLKFDARAIKAMNLLTAALRECYDYQNGVLEQDEIKEAIEDIENAITLIISAEIGKIHNLIWCSYFPEEKRVQGEEKI